ncbi:MAG: threonine dehydratase [Actinomycetota bacterium]|nr:threonine dehydratase [Actinomycetota bacterium]
MTGEPVTRDQVSAAYDTIRPYVRYTPVMPLEPGSLIQGSAEITLKLELLQHTGSFKPRGAFNKLLTSTVPEAGVITASGGNFGRAVAYAAHTLGHPAEIFVPETSPATKIDGIRDLGALVRVVPGYYAEAAVAMQRRAAEHGALLMHPFDQPEVVAGQGTAAVELAEQVPGLDTVLVAMGGGGLIAGVASWLEGSGVKVIGVEPEAAPSMTAALAAGAPVTTQVGGIAADSLGAARVGEIALGTVKRHVAEVVLVPDAAIRDAQSWLWRNCSLVAEPGGAAATAALLSRGYVPEPGERVAVLVCGANCDPGDVMA